MSRVHISVRLSGCLVFQLLFSPHFFEHHHLSLFLSESLFFLHFLVDLAELVVPLIVEELVTRFKHILAYSLSVLIIFHEIFKLPISQRTNGTVINN